MQLAVIKTGGKQYLVSRGQRIAVETLPYESGKEFDFNEVLLLVYAGQVKVGMPFVEGAKDMGRIISHGLHDKVIVFKFKPKKRQKRKKGHRQSYTLVEIMDIKDNALKAEAPVSKPKESQTGQKRKTVASIKAKRAVRRSVSK